jgi:hypothetical protein
LQEFVKAADVHLYNHVDIILSYNDESIISKGSFSIVQFEVVPRSVQYDLSAWPKGEACPQATQQPVLIRGGGESASDRVSLCFFFFFFWFAESASLQNVEPSSVSLVFHDSDFFARFFFFSLVFFFFFTHLF